MAKARSLVGLDVHACKVVAAVLDAETGEVRFSDWLASAATWWWSWRRPSGCSVRLICRMPGGAESTESFAPYG